MALTFRRAEVTDVPAIARDEWQLPTMRMSVIDVRDDGHRRTGIKKPFPYGEERIGIPRRRDLRFEVLEKSLS